VRVLDGLKQAVEDACRVGKVIKEVIWLMRMKFGC
jgi:hypothetical protein